MFNNSKFLKLMSTLTGLLIIIAGIVLNMVYFYPYDIINIKCPIPILNKDKKVVAGNPVEYEIKYTKYYNIPEVISQQLIIDTNYDGEHEYSIIYEPIQINLMPYENNLTLKSDIPLNSETGEGQIKVILRYKMFWGMRVKEITRETEKFKILAEHK